MSRSETKRSREAEELDILRLDCRRHPERPVPLLWVEAPAGAERSAEERVLSGEVLEGKGRVPFRGMRAVSGGTVRLYLGNGSRDGSDERAHGMLERLGRLALEYRDILRRSAVERPDDEEDGLWTGARLVLARGVVKEMEQLSADYRSTPGLAGNELLLEVERAPKDRVVEVRLGSVLEAVAWRCDRLLERDPLTKKEREERDLKTLARILYLIAKDPAITDRAIAKRIGIDPAQYSRRWSKRDEVVRVRAERGTGGRSLVDRDGRSLVDRTSRGD